MKPGALRGRALLRIAGILAALAVSAPLAAQPRGGTMPEWGRPLTPEEGRRLRTEIQGLSARLGVRERTLAAVARILGASLRNISFPELLRRLQAQADRAAELQTQIGTLRVQIAALTDPAVRSPAEQALARATLAFNEGRLEDADREFALLANLRSSDSEAARAAWAEAVEARARVAELRLDYDLAADVRLTAMREERRLSTARQWRFALGAAKALFEKGRLRGDSAAFERAIQVYRQDMLPLVPRSENPLAWARTQHELGLALGEFGKLQTDNARLEEAVAAYRAAQEVWTAEDHRLEWAIVQASLADVLATLGRREQGTARLEEAVAAHSAALARAERVSLNWAAMHVNLGLALVALGRRELDLGYREPGRAHLEEALTALRAALELSPRTRSPQVWAITQLNIGSALSELAQDESGPARLQESTAAYLQALEEIRRDREPLFWANAQDGLGVALWLLGERESGTAHLEQAVAAHLLALEEYPRERVPELWAATQNNLGNALLSLGERQTGTERLEQAISAFQQAVEERTRSRAPVRWGTLSVAIGRAKALIAGRTSNRALLNDAESQVREARTVLEAAGWPLTWTNQVLELIAATQARIDH